MIPNQTARRETARTLREQQQTTFNRAVGKIATLPKIRMFLWRDHVVHWKSIID